MPARSSSLVVRSGAQLLLFALLCLALCTRTCGFRQSSAAGEAVWLLDASDRKCMGPQGFEACSSRTTWAIRGVPGDFRLHYSPQQNDAAVAASSAVGQLQNHKHQQKSQQHQQQHQKCLHRDRCYSRTSSLSLGACGRCGGSKWHLNADGALTHKNRSCVGRNGDFAFLQSCTDGHVALTVAPALAQAEQASSLASLSPKVLAGYFVEPVTSLQLPLNLQPVVSPNQAGSPHILVGAGVFTRTLLQIPVYAVGWYVELPAVANAMRLQSLPNTVDERVYRAMVEPADYDRSLFMKLAITLPTSMLQEGLVETLTVEPEHLEIFTQLCQQHIGGPPGQTRDWNRGAELVFTWRKNGVLEIRADGELLDSVSNPGLAQALFWQFVNDDPISPQAKAAFGEGFLDIVQGKIPRGAFGFPSSPVHGAVHSTDRMIAEQVTLTVTLVLGLLVLVGLKSASSLPKLPLRLFSSSSIPS